MICHRLLQHLLPDVDAWKAAADDMLVELLAGAESEPEAARRQQGHGRRFLRDDRRVIADRRRGHIGHEREPLGRLRRRPEHRPRVWRMALRLDPGMEVVRDDREVEPGVFGPDDILRPGRSASVARTSWCSQWEPRDYSLTSRKEVLGRRIRQCEQDDPLPTFRPPVLTAGSDRLDQARTQAKGCRDALQSPGTLGLTVRERGGTAFRRMGDADGELGPGAR